MKFPKADPDDPNYLSVARRRHTRRLPTPLDAGEQDAFVERLAHQASPSFNFFLYSLLSGVVLGVGLALDHPALVFLGALLAPFMAPAIGIALGTTLGSVPLFVRSLVGFLIGALFVFGVGWVAGDIVQSWFSMSERLFTQARMHAQLSWVNLLILAVGAIWTTSSLTQEEKKALVPSVALSYGIYVPLVAGGFGATSGIERLWPDGLVVFALHFASAVILGAITLAFLGYRPPTLFGYWLGGALAIGGIVLFITFSGSGEGRAVVEQTATPTFTPAVTPMPTPTHTPTPTPTRVPPTPTSPSTLTPSSTLPLTLTLVLPTATPVPLLGVVDVDVGARYRVAPGGETLGFLSNGTVVVMLPETVVLDGFTWVRVIVPDEGEGWMVRSLLAIATPAPNWTP